MGSIYIYIRLHEQKTGTNPSAELLWTLPVDQHSPWTPSQPQQRYGAPSLAPRPWLRWHKQQGTRNRAPVKREADHTGPPLMRHAVREGPVCRFLCWIWRNADLFLCQPHSNAPAKPEERRVFRPSEGSRLSWVPVLKEPFLWV